MSEHRLRLHWDWGDDFPWPTVECDWGDDPERPCLTITCTTCCEYASRECLTAHPKTARVIPGCGARLWLEDAGSEGIEVRGVSVAVPVALKWEGEFWSLDAATPPSRDAREPDFAAAMQLEAEELAAGYPIGQTVKRPTED